MLPLVAPSTAGISLVPSTAAARHPCTFDAFSVFINVHGSYFIIPMAAPCAVAWQHLRHASLPILPSVEIQTFLFVSLHD
jgi:hypothetical protein